MQQERKVNHRFRVSLMWAITILFFGRVYGQFLVTYMEVSWLPSLPYWFSGYIEYQYLLGIQIILLMLMTTINVDNFRQSGYFYVVSETKIKWLRRFCISYILVMVIRLSLHFVYFTDRVWYINMIPITFHRLLAGYIWLVSTAAGINAQEVNKREKKLF